MPALRHVIASNPVTKAYQNAAVGCARGSDCFEEASSSGVPVMNLYEFSYYNDPKPCIPIFWQPKSSP